MAGYDYRLNGAYFVTVCLQHLACLLGRIVGDEMRPNAAGELVLHWWERLPTKWPGIEVDAVVVMPNHIHGIVLMEDSFGLDGIGHIVEKGDHMAVKGDHMGSPLPDGEPPALGDVVGWFKTMTTNAYIRGVKESGWEPFPGRLWQRNYYEHIIRNERGLERIRAYIDGNPARWTEDEENPDRISHR